MTVPMGFAALEQLARNGTDYFQNTMRIKTHRNSERDTITWVR
jgi:hypothetical protein